MNNKSGFTLIEVLISMTILSLIILTATQSINTSINVKSTIIKTGEKHQMFDFLNRLESDINNMVFESYEESEEYLIGYSGDDKTFVKFVANIGIVSAINKYELSNVQYIFKKGILKRQIKPFTNMNYGKWHDDIVLDNIKDFKISFYAGGEHYTFFPNTNTKGNRLPQGLRIKITTKDNKQYTKWIYIAPQG